MLVIIIGIVTMCIFICVWCHKKRIHRRILAEGNHTVSMMPYNTENPEDVVSLKTIHDKSKRGFVVKPKRMGAKDIQKDVDELEDKIIKQLKGGPEIILLPESVSRG